LTKSFLYDIIDLSKKEVNVMFTVYQNLSTGEITFSHEEAVGFYREGAEVAVLVDHGSYLEQKAMWIH
jgi:hypothetical protein